jgi:hypothetical protein
VAAAAAVADLLLLLLLLPGRDLRHHIRGCCLPVLLTQLLLAMLQ